MTELEQIKADLATLDAANEIVDNLGFYGISPKIKTVCSLLKSRIAELEAQSVDEWAEAKRVLECWNKYYASPIQSSHTIAVMKYATHLEARVAEIDHELQSAKQARAEQLIQEGLASPPVWAIRTADGEFLRLGNLVQVYTDKELAYMIAEPNNLVVVHWQGQE